MSKSPSKAEKSVDEKDRIFSVRFIVSLVLAVLGIAWIVFQYVVVRVDPSVFPPEEPGGPKFLGDIGLWSYGIGFGLLMIGLSLMAHPSTPMGRGRGVVIGMLGCFLIGLVWICVFYIFSGAEHRDLIPVINDLGNYNLVVGIAFMAVGFSFATRWE